MTPDDFRRLALSMPDAAEASHQGHPDFRVAGKIFATLGWPDGAFAMVKLTAEQQAMVVAAMPKAFSPVPGGWGRSGSTSVRLAAADEASVQSAVATAWRNVAPKALVKRLAAADPSPAGSPAQPTDAPFERAFARIRAVASAAGLPEIEEGTSFGTPAMKLRGKLLMRVKDQDTLVFRCPIEEKEMLLEAAPEIYFETDHYKGWPAVLVRLSRASDAELCACLARAWQLQAPAKLRAGREGKMESAPKRKVRRSS